jgi:hypothetical protein
VTDYLIVVKRGKQELKTILEIAFRGRDRFTVIEDRRVTVRRVRPERERRRGGEALRLQDFIVAERSESSDL